MQLRLDAADRLVELVEERRGPVVAEEAARRLFALRQAPVALARSLLADVVDADARLAWNGDAVGLAEPLGADLLLEDATYVVVDLETTGLRPGTSQICEIGAVRIVGFEIVDEFETLVDPRQPLQPGVSALTGLTDRQLRGQPPPSRLREAPPRARRAAAARHLHLERPQRAGALRGPGARPTGALAFVLPLRQAAACGRGGARGGRAHRVARARVGARGCARGAAPDPRPAPARERAGRAPGPKRLAAEARRGRRLLIDRDVGRAVALAPARADRGTRAT